MVRSTRRISGALATVAIVAVLVLLASCAKAHQTKAPAEVTIVGPLTAFTWPVYIAMEAGYYEKHGVHVKLMFANHPAGIAALESGEAQVNLNTLQQAMQLAPKDSSLVAIGSPLNKWLFALLAQREIEGVANLKGKRVGVSQIGDSTYNYALRLLQKFGLSANDVQWVVTGSEGRIPALMSRRIDATMLSAPAYFALENAGFKSLANINDYDDIHTPNVFLMKRATVEKNPHLPELLVKAHAEAVRRFYNDEEFAIKAHLAYDKQDVAGLKRVYETYRKTNAFARVPYILQDAVAFMITNAPDAALRTQMQVFDYRTSIDNRVIARLVNQGFFEELFGADIKWEEESLSELAFH